MWVSSWRWCWSYSTKSGPSPTCAVKGLLGHAGILLEEVLVPQNEVQPKLQLCGTESCWELLGAAVGCQVLLWRNAMFKLV